MNAEELKRYDAYPLLVSALRETMDNLSVFGSDEMGYFMGSSEAVLKNGNALLKALGEKPVELD